VIFVDVPLQEGAVRRIAVDVALVDVDMTRVQKTSGVAAGRSGRLPEENGLGHVHQL
jgi:hypothetical protein